MLRVVTATLLALVFANSAIADPLPVYSGESDGQRYSYTAEAIGHNVIRLKGTTDAGQDFVLYVSNKGLVTGTFGFSQVAFRVSRATRDQAAAAIRLQAEAPAAATLTSASR